MKKMNLAISCFALCGVLVACNSSSDNSTSSTSDSSHMSTTTNSATTATTNDTSTNQSTVSTASKTPLNAKDSEFVMKAAAGGMMEVSAGNTAQTNAMNGRVKAFGAMMVSDHSKANSELMSLASAKGITLPAALPANEQKHVDEMSKLKGKDFDNHYMSMMLNDHKKDVAEFEKEASSATDTDLKAWAAKTLPTLKAHLDSAQAISKSKM
jgi:putative membrane protein